MRTIITETTVYKFNELSEEAKEKAIEKLYDINTDYEWYDFTYCDAKEIGAIIGIDINNIYFSGFSFQGDGACFEGSYSYKKGSLKAIKKYAPKDEVLHQIAKNLQAIQSENFYKLHASIKHSGYYYHENCTNIDVYHCDDIYRNITKETEGGIKEALRDFMRWIYSTLEKEYDYLTSKENIIETIKANDYEFTAEGDLV
jgi:hypothetical protein